MRRLLAAVMLIMLLAAPAQAADEGIYQDELRQTEDQLAYLDEVLAAELEGISLQELWDDIKAGGADLDPAKIVRALGAYAFQEASGSLRLLAKLLLLAVFSLLITTLSGSFAKAEVASLSRSVVFLFLLSIILADFSALALGAKAAVGLISDFFYAILPVMMVLLASIGGVTTVAILNPALLFVIGLLLRLIEYVIFPLVYFSAILRVVGQVSGRFSLDKAADLIKTVSLGFLTVSCAVFTAFLAILGVATASMDGIAVKAAKSAGGIFIPVVGKSLSDALDSVLATALLLKNSLGLLAVLVIILLCALPAVKIILQALIYKLAAAIAEPLGDSELAEALNGVGSALILFFAVLAIAGLLFFFLLGIVIACGNLTMMFR